MSRRHKESHQYIDVISMFKPVTKWNTSLPKAEVIPEAVRKAFKISLAEAQAIIEAWRLDYNARRPHSSLGHLTPNEFLEQRQGNQIAEEAVCSG